MNAQYLVVRRSVLLALPVDEKRAFLQFCTGCDRAPVAGLGALRLLVQVRHTCTSFLRNRQKTVVCAFHSSMPL
jgi:hypothetical protein